MKTGRLVLLIIFFFSLSVQLFAFGRREADEPEPVKRNNEWVLVVTAFDISALPEGRQAIASVITGRIVDRLMGISYRTRVSYEHAYYEGYAWAQARSAAARALAARHEERSLLIFRGDPGWRHRQNLARVEAEIERLTIAFEEISNNPPLINEQPLFRLTSANMDGVFPPAPAPGREFRFCVDQRADGFITGKVTEFHGRFHLTIRLFTVYRRAFVFEDSVLFSPEDLDEALDEIVDNLLVLLSGNRPAGIIVQTEPEDSLVLINRSFAGRGDTGLMEFPPGRFVITASAPDHESMTIETELSSGEIANIQMTLIPLVYTTVQIPGTLYGGSVYRGALYVGETPLTLRLPLSTMEVIELETFDGRRGTVAFTTPDFPDASYSLYIPTSIPPAPGRVDRSRRTYYWAWGLQWITGITAWVTYHSYVSSNDALRHSQAATGAVDPNFVNANRRMYYVSMGAMVAFGVASVYGIIQMVRYIRNSNRGSTPYRRLQAVGSE